MEIDGSPNRYSNRKLARVRPTLAHRPHGVLFGMDTVATRHLPPAPSSKRTGGSVDSSARQHALICDLLNDEQWGNDLSISSSHEAACHPSREY